MASFHSSQYSDFNSLCTRTARNIDKSFNKNKSNEQLIVHLKLYKQDYTPVYLSLYLPLLLSRIRINIFRVFAHKSDYKNNNPDNKFKEISFDY